MSENLKEQVKRKMIDFYAGNRKDVSHFLKVHSYAALIAEAEGLDEETAETLELAALVHDIACPLCRIRYGNTAGKHQEEESEALLRVFLEEFHLPEKQEERIIFLVSRHHSHMASLGLDHRILLEADYLVNCDESEKYRKVYGQFKKNVFQTKTGISLLESLFPEEEEKLKKECMQ